MASVKPRLLDLFSKAGGAAMGYHRAGFEVVGVDIEPQKNYPFEFIQADVMTTLSYKFMASFDAIHASPPCQGYTALRHAPGTIGAPKLIPAVRRLLGASGRPYIIENVEEAREYMIDPVMLCGSSFQLGAQGCQLRRHRLFESNIPLSAPPCQHDERPVIGVYGGHARRRAARHGGRGTQDVWEGGHVAACSEAMGIDWMSLSEMSEAIPPAYTKYLGKRLMKHIATQYEQRMHKAFMATADFS